MVVGRSNRCIDHGPHHCKRKDKDLLLAVYISNDIVTGLEPATP